MNRLKNAQYVALGAIVVSVIGGVLGANNVGFGGILLGLGFLAGLVAYIFGGLEQRLRWLERLQNGDG